MLAPNLARFLPHPAPDRYPTFDPPIRALPFNFREGDLPEPGEWTEEDIVYLHWRLLDQIGDLADPQSPLEEKLDTLRWIFTEPDKDARPFSFVSCLRVVCASPLSPIPYCGRVDAQEMRDRLRLHVTRWLNASLERYPDWVRQAVIARPGWVHEHLARNS